MKLTEVLRKAATRLKPKRTKKPKPPKPPKPPRPPKPVKKNTFRRRLKAWDLRLDRRRQLRTTGDVKMDDTQRTCSNCGVAYTGRICPQCGQAGTWTRYSWRQASMNFLDIWGLGNRPIFRTVKELFWRPGYMVRDYLNGHRNFYFPPFKLLAVTVVLLFLASKIAGVEQESLFGEFKDIELSDSTVVADAAPVTIFSEVSASPDEEDVSPSPADNPEKTTTDYMITVESVFFTFAKFMASNMLYEWLFIAAFAGLCIWIVFRHKSNYTLVETFIFYIFILSQNLLLNIPRVLVTGLHDSLEPLAVNVQAGGMAGALGAGASVLLVVLMIVQVCYVLLLVYLTLIDFRQFYGMSWTTVIKYIPLSIFVGGLLMLWLGILLTIIFFVEESVYMGVIILILLLLPVSIVIADRVYNRNKDIVPSMVIWVSKILMLSVLISGLLAKSMHDNHFNIIASYVLVILYIAAATAISLLPVFLYKKFRRTWIACLPTSLIMLSLYAACVSI